MLVLSRKRNEKIIMKIDEERQIELTVIRIEHNRVRLGIDAPKEVNIIRSELLTRNKEKTKENNTENNKENTTEVVQEISTTTG